MCHRHYDLHAEALRDIEAEFEATDADEPGDAEERAPAVADD